MKVAVISDLHIGDGAKGKDFSPNPGTNASVENYLGVFKEFAKEHDVKADYLVVPGDITNRSQQDEVDLASSLVKEIAESLQVKKENILFCLGNHDSDWSAETALRERSVAEETILKAKYSNFLARENLFKERHAQGIGSFDEQPCFLKWEADDLIAYSFNSASYDKPEERPHSGKISSKQLTLLEKSFSQTLDQADQRLKLFILHHHPILYHDKTFEDRDLSAMANAQGLIDLLSKYQFNFVIHGHKHVPRFQMTSSSFGSPLWILCAGSFSARLDDRWFSGIANNFHLVEFHQRNKATGSHLGVVNTWSHMIMHGWQKSTRHFGIEHQKFFGSCLNPLEVKTKIETILERELLEKNHIYWQDLAHAEENVKYLNNEVIIEALNEINREKRFIAHDLSQVDLNRIMIVRGDPA